MQRDICGWMGGMKVNMVGFVYRSVTMNRFWKVNKFSWDFNHLALLTNFLRTILSSSQLLPPSLLRFYIS